MAKKKTYQQDPNDPSRQGYKVCNVIHVKPYSKKELCNMYDVKPRVLANWLRPFLEEIGIMRGRYFTVLQVEVIYNRIGLPYDLREED